MSQDLTTTGGKRNGRAAGRPNTGDRLLPTAAALFRRQGYASASTRELADLLGIRKASLYHHIRSKEDLLQAICAQSLGEIHEAVSRVARSTPPEGRLRAMIERHMVSALDNADMHAVMLIELRNLSAPCLAEIIELRDDYERLLRDAVAADQRAGRLRKKPDAKYLTLALLNLLNWTIFWYRADAQLTAAQLGAMFADVFLNGARSPGA